MNSLGPPNNKFPKGIYCFWIVWGFLYWGIHLLIPVDRGIPPLKLVGAPFYIPMLINLFCILILSLIDLSLIIEAFGKKWVLLNLLFIAWSTFSSLLTFDWRTSFYYGFFWLSNYVIAYVCVYFLIEKIKIRGLVLIFTVIVSVQIFVGICESIGDYKFMFYKLASINYFREMGANVLGARGTVWDLRTMGTMGDPILFGTAIMLSVPILSKVRNIWARSILIFLSILIALSTLSRSVIIFFILYSLFFLLTSSTKKMIRLTPVVIILSVLSLFFATQLIGNWQARLNESKVEDTSGGIVLRVEMAENTLHRIFISNDPAFAIWGKGFYSTNELGGAFQEVSTTIDNSYLTILYENGVIGLILFCGLCWTPLCRKQKGLMPLASWGYLGALIAGFSFVTFRTMSISLLIVTLIVVIQRSESWDDSSASIQ